jgi:hypothetical protein
MGDLQMRSAVDEAAKCFPTAIVTGRSRDKVLILLLIHHLLYKVLYVPVRMVYVFELIETVYISLLLGC